MRSTAGFTVIEIIVAVLFISLVAGLVVPTVSSSVKYADQTTTRSDLRQLNQCVDFFRSSVGPLPTGDNNTEHHRAVLVALDSASLIKASSIDVAKLQSKGSGDGFIFTRYRDIAIDGNAVDTPAEHGFRAPTWCGSSIGGSQWAPDGKDFRLKPPRSDAQETVVAQEQSKPLEKQILDELQSMVENRRRQAAEAERNAWFTRPGKHEWIVPKGVTSLIIEMIGGGGGGGVAQSYKAWGPVKKEMVSIRATLMPNPGNNEYWDAMGAHGVQGPARVANNDPASNLVANPYGSNKFYPGHTYPRLGSVVEWHTTEAKSFTYRAASMHYGTIFIPPIYTISLDVQYEETKIKPGFGGGMGGINRQVINGLHGGEVVVITVGNGGALNSNGEATTITINGQNHIAPGGNAATQPNGSGTMGGFIGPDGNPDYGSGGNGQQTPDITNLSMHGKNGLLHITYKING